MKGYKNKFASLSKEDQAQVLIYESAIKAARKERHRIVDRVGHRKTRVKRVLNEFSDYMQARLNYMRAFPNEPENRAITASIKDLYNQGIMTNDDMHAIFSALYMSELSADDIWTKPLADVMEYIDKNSEFYQYIITKYVTGDIDALQKANTARYASTITAEEERDKYQYEQQIKNYQAAIEAIFNK